MKIAAILTVFNRRHKTVSCLQHLLKASDDYNRSADDHIDLSVFITDDGCTDGTSEAVKSEFPTADIHIIEGTGSLFWAGGMRLAWQTAIDCGISWDYFLLLNDDTNVFSNVFQELFGADSHGFRQKGCHGLSSGVTCQPGNPDEVTYGGFNFASKAKGRRVIVQPTGKPQPVDLVHANILLVHHSVVESIGVFYAGYKHSSADFDYGMLARRHGFPTMVTANVCGECECDHDTDKEEIHKLMEMSLAERKRHVTSPTRSDRDYLTFVRRNLPLRYPLAVILRSVRLYLPSLYCHITRLRGVYKQLSH